MVHDEWGLSRRCVVRSEASCHGTEIRLRMRAALGTAIVLVSAPVVVPLFSGRIASALVERVLLSHYFYGTLILLGALIAVRLSTATTEPDAPHRGLS